MTVLDADTARMIIDSVAGYARASEATDPLAELHAQGWLHCALPEEAGGLGFGVDGAVLIAGGLARACRAEPVTATFMAARMLALVAPQSAPAGQLAEEGRLVSLVMGTVGVEEGRLSGTLRHVSKAEQHLVVADGELFVLRGGTEWRARVDGVQLETLALDNAEADRIAEGAVVAAAYRQVRAEGRLVIAAELLAHAEVMLEITLEHMRTRQQFGHSLGHFQALQHKAVDLYCAALLSRRSGCCGCAGGTRSISRRPRPSVLPGQGAGERLRHGRGPGRDPDVRGAGHHRREPPCPPYQTRACAGPVARHLSRIAPYLCPNRTNVDQN